MSDPSVEAKRLAELCADDPLELLRLLSSQLATVKTQAQVMISLTSVIITVTGFSGAHIVASGPGPAGLMLTGIGLILVAAVECLRTLTETRWVTQELGDSLVGTAETVILRRNRLQRRLTVAGRFVGGGLLAYLSAVAVAAVVA
ncbi:MAG: hypothetical protein U1E65_28365 [Myxococcota bacterium]